MMSFKPDVLNGKKILRGVYPDGGMMVQSTAVMHPPTVVRGKPPILHPDQLVELALKDLITVSDQTGDAVIKAQAVTFRKKLKAHQTAWLARAAENEREIIRAYLMAHGFTNAAEAL